MHIIARMNVGGPAVEIAELMRGLDPLVFSQRLVTGSCADDEADFLETQAPDISVTRILGLGKRISLIGDIRALAKLVRLIRASRPDVVHTHTAKAGVLGRIAARISGTGTQVIHTHHGHLLHGYFGPIGTRAFTQIERHLAKFTDHLVTVGDKVRDDLLGVGIGRPDQYSVIRSGVRLGALPEKASARRELGLPDGTAIVLMLGRLTQIKRPDRFLEVVRLIQQRGLNAHFVVAGGGDHEFALRVRIAREGLPVTMLGWRDDVERLLAASDIVILTSDNEGAPLSLIQAGLVGLPVVATRVGSVPEIVSDGETGILCDPRVESVADAVAYLVRSPAEARRMGEQALVFVKKNFGRIRFLEEHASLYRN